MEAKTAEDVYKMHLVEGRTPTGEAPGSKAVCCLLLHGHALATSHRHLAARLLCVAAWACCGSSLAACAKYWRRGGRPLVAGVAERAALATGPCCGIGWQQRAHPPCSSIALRLGWLAPSSAGPAVDSARANLAATFVNAFVNAGFGQDKLVTAVSEDEKVGGRDGDVQLATNCCWSRWHVWPGGGGGGFNGGGAMPCT